MNILSKRFVTLYSRSVTEILAKSKAPPPFHLYPHEVAESEEKETTTWGVTSDTSFDTVETSIKDLHSKQ
jgi:hypothetical protein